jgi:polysaccharide export outer membrane protein
MHCFHWGLFVLCTAFALGCGSQAVVTNKQMPLPSPVVSVQAERLDPKVLAELVAQEEKGPYRVGPGDSVLVAVYGHPELAMTPYISSVGGNGSQNSRMAGLVVDNDGTIQFPLIGPVQVAGKSSAEMHELLKVQLARFVNDPQIIVQVIGTRSIRYHLLGQFNDPGLKFSDRPMCLLEALSLGGSVTLERASLRTAYLVRNGHRLPIDFRRLVLDGDMSQNIPLRTGDTVVIPDRSSEQAFVFGAAASGNQRGGVVPFLNGQLNLLQALAQAGFGYRDGAQGNLSNTHIIRSSGDRGALYIVDARGILKGEAAPFELAPGDVVYVPPTGFTTWNEALQQLLPTLQVVSGLLQPFVEIKYLSP